MRGAKAASRDRPAVRVDGIGSSMDGDLAARIRAARLVETQSASLREVGLDETGPRGRRRLLRWLGTAGAGGTGLSGFGRTTAGLINLVILLPFWSTEKKNMEQSQVAQSQHSA